MKNYAYASILLILAALIVMLIILTPPKIPENCLEKPFSYQRIVCLEPYFEDLTLEKNAEVAMKKAIEMRNNGIIDDCHLVAHYIGEANLKKNDFSVGKAFSTCSLGCIEGCYHGVMESLISNDDNKEEVIAKIPNLCYPISNNPLLFRQCIHGIGHGLLAHNFLPIEDAILTCKVFNDSFKEETCLGGLFMENMDQYLIFDEDFLKDKIISICNFSKSNDQKLNEMCLKAIGEGLMFYSGHNLDKSIDFCNILPDSEKQICIEGAEEEFELNLRNTQ